MHVHNKAIDLGCAAALCMTSALLVKSRHTKHCVLVCEAATVTALLLHSYGLQMCFVISQPADSRAQIIACCGWTCISCIAHTCS